MPELVVYLCGIVTGAVLDIGVREFVSWRREAREFEAEKRRDAEWDREHGIGGRRG